MNPEPFIYQFELADYYVITGYLILLSSLGFIVKKLCNSSRDFLIGGNRIPWWLAGGSIFMMSFSAWTFTGAAGFAYEHGVLIILLFYFNVIAFIIGGRFLAARIRQTRHVTFGQIVHERFGRGAEQFFVWIQIPKLLFGGAIWLLGLAVFVSAAFGVPMTLTILVTGGVILLYSTVSGSWAVITNDFLQALILLALSITIAVLCLIEVGGFRELTTNMGTDHLRILSDEHSWMWVVAYFVQIIIIFNSVMGANRYLTVREGKDASKAAYMAAILFIVAPLIWFIPPFAASFIFPNIDEALPLLNHANDGAYVLMALHVLPAGLAGLLLMAIFAATLSSMDSAINMNAGIITMNVYKPLFRPEASDRELFITSRVFNVLCGLTVIGSTYALSSIEGMNLFDLMLLMSAGVALPLAIPCILLFIFRKTPRWAAVCCVLLCGAFSFYGLQSDLNLFTRVFGMTLIGFVTFAVSGLFWNKCTSKVKDSVENFYTKMETPVDPTSEVKGPEVVTHLYLVGVVSMVVGVGLMLATVFPNSTGGRITIMTTASVIMVTGIIFYKIGIRSINRFKNEKNF